MLTGIGLADYAISLLGAPYVYGVNGDVITESLIQRKAIQYPGYYTPGYIAKARQFIGQRAYDCSSITDLYTGTDRSANGWLASCAEKGAISTMPEIIGLIVHKDHHMGVYIGQGWAIEARGIDYGVVKTRVSDRPWTSWGKVPGVEYTAPGEGDIMLQRGDKGLAVTYWQKSLLKWNPASLPRYGADSDFGGETEAGTKLFQTAIGLDQTGIVNTATFAYMLNVLDGITTGITNAEYDALSARCDAITVERDSLAQQYDTETRISAEWAQTAANRLNDLKLFAKCEADKQSLVNRYINM